MRVLVNPIPTGANGGGARTGRCSASSSSRGALLLNVLPKFAKHCIPLSTNSITTVPQHGTQRCLTACRGQDQPKQATTFKSDASITLQNQKHRTQNTGAKYTLCPAHKSPGPVSIPPSTESQQNARDKHLTHAGRHSDSSPSVPFVSFHLFIPRIPSCASNFKVGEGVCSVTV